MWLPGGWPPTRGVVIASFVVAVLVVVIYRVGI
jgi:hypothetical protein